MTNPINPARYNSVYREFASKSKEPSNNFSLSQVLEKMTEFRQLVREHKNPSDDFSLQEQEWLIELLTWEHFRIYLLSFFCGFYALTAAVPNEKSFPGKRPLNSKKQTRVEAAYMPPCPACKNHGGTGRDLNCPYVRMVACSKDHPQFMMRYGTETFRGPACPKCYAEMAEELDDGWIFT